MEVIAVTVCVFQLNCLCNGEGKAKSQILFPVVVSQGEFGLTKDSLAV